MSARAGGAAPRPEGEPRAGPAGRVLPGRVGGGRGAGRAAPRKPGAGESGRPRAYPPGLGDRRRALPPLLCAARGDPLPGPAAGVLPRRRLQLPPRSRQHRPARERREQKSCRERQLVGFGGGGGGVGRRGRLAGGSRGRSSRGQLVGGAAGRRGGGAPLQVPAGLGSSEGRLDFSPLLRCSRQGLFMDTSAAFLVQRSPYLLSECLISFHHDTVGMQKILPITENSIITSNIPP
ncbi:unnamed protein product [Nyctereutes procyonoides]|uniref:(raccoon dog) hypothetical protein n=1 Tax=Nyctereutes procyonoides TaxID=34880 RepID=A0A811ZPH6_NYCPR|nr:unnamed protein product [Nyctereutes procyonoides]